MELFGIHLTANRSTYIPGDVVTGEVVLQFGATRQIRELKVAITGICRVKCKHLIIKHREKEEYFNVEKTLIDDESSESDKRLSPGAPYIKYFELDVPTGDFPPSFQSDNGHVRYDVIMRLRMADDSSKGELMTSKPFKMITKNLGHSGDGVGMMESQSRDQTIDRPRIFPLKRRSLRAQVVTASDQNATRLIRIYSCGHDQGNDDQTNVQCLIQKITYRVGPFRKYNRLRTIDCDVMWCREDDDQNDVTCLTLTIPRHELIHMNHCRLISVKYYLRLSHAAYGHKMIRLRFEQGLVQN